MKGWRSIVVKTESKLSQKGGALHVESEQADTVISFNQIREILVETPRCTVTAALLQSLAKEGIPVILCDERHMPAAEMTPYGGTTESAGKIMDQALWSREIKDAAWEKIAKQKIRSQMQALSVLDIPVPGEMIRCERELQGADEGACEAMAAKIYFQALFGKQFARWRPSEVNAMLNYGYTVLQSLVSRVIRSHGYITELGVHHCSRVNPFNLTCDIMEPFRPVVDLVVATVKEGELTPETKRMLIDISTATLRYKGREYRLGDAVDAYFVDVAEFLQNGAHEIGEITLDR